ASRVTPGDVEKYAHLITKLQQLGVKVITILDAEYPGNLRAIYNRPPMLFVKGDLRPEDERAVAVVGTRKPSKEGLSQAHDLAYELTRRQITVLSGLARGIDTAAHTGTLDAGGRTIAVMGTGIDSIYPPENRDLADRILNSGGALVSQFFPDAPPRSM